MKLEKPIKLTQVRRAGHSTGLVLEAIGKAMQSPGTTIKITDRDTSSNKQTETILKRTAISIIENMGFRDINVRVVEAALLITSNLNPVYTTDDHRMFEERK